MYFFFAFETQLTQITYLTCVPLIWTPPPSSVSRFEESLSLASSSRPAIRRHQKSERASGYRDACKWWWLASKIKMWLFFVSEYWATFTWLTSILNDRDIQKIFFLKSTYRYLTRTAEEENIMTSLQKHCPGYSETEKKRFWEISCHANNEIEGNMHVERWEGDEKNVII